ncbi:DNA translocase FtsK [Treponema sp.]|uniref:DNA translocase FtsK n=1 Tax=Treponema sp. TaxID=166 RepID=UPI00257B0D23|nr:DNA translocase FtsK [Treponema sp.]MBE6353392.1 hypothetical protein [Treponema sp.]
MKQDKLTAYITGIVLFVIAAIFSVSIVSAVLELGTDEGFLYSFGNFIVSAYGVCSLLIPAFLLTAGCFCFMENWSVQKACILLVSLIPFFTLVFAERTCRRISENDFGPISFVKIVTTIVVALLLVATEYLLAVVLAGKFHDRLVDIKLPFTKKDDDENNGLSFVDETSDKKDSEENNDELYEDKTDEDDSVGILGRKRREIEKAALEIEQEETAPRKYESIWSIDENGDVKNEEKNEIKADETESEDESEDESVKETESEGNTDESEKGVLLSEGIADVSRTSPVDRDDLPRQIYLSDSESDDEEVEIKTPAARSSIINLAPPEDIKVVDLQNLEKDPPVEFENSSDDAEDDIIAQFERENLQFENDKEENPFEEETSEEYTSEIPFEEFDEAAAPERRDTNVNRLMEKFDAIADEEDAVIAEDVAEPDVEFENPFSDEEEEFVPEFDSEIENSVEGETKTETDSEAESESETSSDEAQKKTSEIIPAGTSSIMSSLDSVFSKMDEDAKAQVEKVEVKGKTAVVTDENGNTQPIKVTPKIRRKPYKISTDLLTEYEQNAYWEIDDETRHAAGSLMATLKEFNIEANVTEIRKGPVVTMFEILPAPGVRLSKIQALQDNIALRLAAKSVRIVAPIPGKRAVGIEVPNKNRAIVSFRECIEQNRPEWKKMAVPVVLGKDIEGETQLMDLVKTPHLLIAGSTGAGKSVCVNSMILSILYKRSPNEVKMILIDPKIVELSLYNGIGHLLTPVITEPKMAMQALQYCLCEMERRYAVLKGMGCRDIASYNQKIQEQHIATEKLPYIVVVIDEFADLMATTGKQLEQSVARLAAKARAIGIHLVLATQRPSVDVITGLIKANIPSRIAFMVSSKMDSRIIIDQMGADKLLGKGDMLYASSTDPFPVRIQGAFVSDQEVENVVNEVKNIWGEPEYIDEEIFVDDEDDGSDGQMSLFGEGEDPLYEKALDVVIQAGKASASYIQRRLSIGYNRAARLIEEMEERGIVGPANGSKPREIIHMP